jgi:hypothetical protein
MECLPMPERTKQDLGDRRLVLQLECLKHQWLLDQISTNAINYSIIIKSITHSLPALDSTMCRCTLHHWSVIRTDFRYHNPRKLRGPSCLSPKSTIWDCISDLFRLKIQLKKINKQMVNKQQSPHNVDANHKSELPVSIITGNDCKKIFIKYITVLKKK